MDDKLMKRVEELDNISLSDISEEMTLDEAESVVFIWGKFLEFTGFLSALFYTNIPESILPFPKYIIVGAINKMMAIYQKQGLYDKVKNLQETRIMLISYTNDEDAIREVVNLFKNEDVKNLTIDNLKKLQIRFMEDGFFVSNKLFKLDESRIDFFKNLIKK